VRLCVLCVFYEAAVASQAVLYSFKLPLHLFVAATKQ